MQIGTGANPYTETYTYDANNRMTSKVKTKGDEVTTTTYTYDNNGNLLTEQTGENVKQYTYDKKNRLIGYTADGVTASYTYSLTGKRESKTVNGETIYYAWLGDNLIAEYNEDGITKKYVYDQTGILKAYTDDTANPELYYLKDGHGNAETLLKPNGTVYEDYNYTAFGTTLENSTLDNPFRYCGEYYDTETGLIYLRNRYYSADVGRFITEDPIRDGLNWYVYCGNNPVNFVDPWGLIPTALEAAYMAEHIYGEYDIELEKQGSVIVDSWELIDIFDAGILSTIKIGVYIPYGDDWTNPSEYALVYRGSTLKLDMETVGVWTNNLLASTSNHSMDMWAAISAGMYFDATHSQEITFIGHSKGGGEAIAAATATNNNAITFNAANFDFSSYGLSETNKNGIINFYIDGEILSSSPIGKSSLGTNITFKTQYWNEYDLFGRKIKFPSPLKNHSMDAFFKLWGVER